MKTDKAAIASIGGRFLRNRYVGFTNLFPFTMAGASMRSARKPFSAAPD
jgi:hypothetical protein